MRIIKKGKDARKSFSGLRHSKGDNTTYIDIRLGCTRRYWIHWIRHDGLLRASLFCCDTRWCSTRSLLRPFGGQIEVYLNCFESIKKYGWGSFSSRFELIDESYQVMFVRLFYEDFKQWVRVSVIRVRFLGWGLGRGLRDTDAQASRRNVLPKG